MVSQTVLGWLSVFSKRAIFESQKGILSWNPLRAFPREAGEERGRMMNVEQLIEDAEKSWMSMSQVFRDTSSKLDCVEFGVRHAIAAMFPVVKVEDLKEGDCYFAYCPQQGFGWSFAKLDHSGEFACVDINGTMEWWPHPKLALLG